VSNLSLILEEKSKELYLLKRKRKLEFFRKENKHDNIIQKEQNFTIINNSKLEAIKRVNKPRNIINGLQLDPINYEANNKFIIESPNKLKQEENINSKNIIDDKKGYFINNNSSINNSPKKLKYLNIEKNIYINTNLLNNYSTSRTIKKLKKINFIKINKTSSKYRGVSRNGNYWQVLIMIHNKKYYIGSYPSEEIAARIYDIVAIKNRGVKARTNFPYNNTQIKNIYESNINIKSDKITEIIKQLNN